MRILIITLLLVLSYRLFAQDKIVGRYRDYFGSRIKLNADSTFKYTWNFDLSSSWTKGLWALKNDTVYFHMVPTYDTVTFSNANSLTVDSLILSTGEIPERFTQEQFVAMLLSSGGQNKMKHSDKLLFRRDRLYEVRNGQLVTKKLKGIIPGKKWNPWFFKSAD